jgi:glycosyltransferase involved in cell wall biosynthesis
MRIGLVSEEYPPDTARGGIGTQTWNKAEALTRLGHEVHVLSCAAGAGDAPDLVTTSAGGVAVHRMQPPAEEPGREFPVFEQAAYSLGYTWSVARHLHQLMEASQFDVFNFPEYGAEGFAYQLNRTRWNWVPVVVQLHGPLAMFSERIGWPPPESDYYRIGTYLEGASIRWADALMASSANIADFTSDFYGVPRESIGVVHCGVDADVFQPPSNGEAPPRPTVLFAGNVAPNKGVTIVFEAVMRLRERFPNILLRILGKGDDRLATELERRARADGAAGNLEILGFVGDRSALPDLYRSASVFCSPAQHEVGVANVYVEAMACGCPVVASTTGGAPEAVDEGESGLLVRPGDVDATAAALDRILSDPELRGRMGAASRRRVEDYFARERYIARVLSVYEDGIERGRERLTSLEASADGTSEPRPAITVETAR